MLLTLHNFLFNDNYRGIPGDLIKNFLLLTVRLIFEETMVLYKLIKITVRVNVTLFICLDYSCFVFYILHR